MKFIEEQVKNVIVGSGAAGFAAGIRLLQEGESDTVLITENVLAGTSRNTGSDKQTYYKLSLAGSDPDSVLAMTKDLFSGGCVDGDTALCEAALSARGFFHLVEAGVPFPCTGFGEYMGYKTDHDTGRRATSAGPYTSKLMTEALEEKAKGMGLQIRDHVQAIRLLEEDGRIRGVLALDTNDKNNPRYRIFWAQNVILATGGPAAVYRDSVYPASQTGSSGLAFEAGAKGKNLTEWQFGIASISPRWNVSGTYMQVLPRFVSVDENGAEHEFLNDHFPNPEKQLSMVFLKGYQWPFDVRKVFGGSSIIDLLVYQESVLKGRKVYLDFTKNPCGGSFDFEKLDPEARDYLKNAGACFGSPIERLEVMNRPAIDFYLDHGVDLFRDYLPVAVCAQHNNGGIAADAWWETDVEGLFAIGECNGSHGVTRPGGTALNAGQTGAMRAAEAIFMKDESKEEISEDSRKRLIRECEEFVLLPERCHGEKTIRELWTQAAAEMSACAGMIRDRRQIEGLRKKTDERLYSLDAELQSVPKSALGAFYHLRDLLLTQKMILAAMSDYMDRQGKSRGSALYTDPNGCLPAKDMPELFSCSLDEGTLNPWIQEVRLNPKTHDVQAKWRPCRPVPEVDYFFENQWKEYRERRNIDKDKGEGGTSASELKE